jgi:hypothetical protein
MTYFKICVPRDALRSFFVCLFIHYIFIYYFVFMPVITRSQARASMSSSIYSLFLHIQYPGHGLKSSYEDGLFITFPSATTKAIVGEHDIYINRVPDSKVHTFQEGLPIQLTTLNAQFTMASSTDTIYRNIKQFQSELQAETTYLDNLLENLRNFYNIVKTRRQLNLEVPAGFRVDNQHTQQVRHYLHTIRDDALPSLTDPSEPFESISALVDQLPMDTIPSVDNTNESSSSIDIPIVRSVDKPSSSLPKHIAMSEDYICASLGFRRLDTLKSQLKHLYQDTVSIDSLPTDAVLDHGDLASIHCKNINKFYISRTPVFHRDSAY